MTSYSRKEARLSRTYAPRAGHGTAGYCAIGSGAIRLVPVPIDADQRKDDAQ